MADKGKAKLLPEESSSSTRRPRKTVVNVQETTSLKTQPAQAHLSVEEQEQEDLFQAELISMLGTFQELIKNPRMKKFMKFQEEDSPAHTPAHAQEEQSESVPKSQRHAEKIQTAIGRAPESVCAQDPNPNGLKQPMLQNAPPKMALNPGYFGGGSVFQAMAMPAGLPGMLPSGHLNPLYANIGVQSGFRVAYGNPMKFLGILRNKLQDLHLQVKESTCLFVQEELDLEAHVLKVGNKIAVASVDIRHKVSGKVAAQGRVTMYLNVDSKL